MPTGHGSSSTPTSADPAPDAVSHAAATAPNASLKVVLKDFVARLGKERTMGLAAEMAFWLFLSLIPIAAVTGLVAARFALHNSSVSDPILQAMPPAARDAMSKQLASVAAWNGGAVAPISALMFVWLASSGIHSIFDALELQTATARPWWKKRAIAIGVCVVLSIGLAVLTLLGTGVEWISHALENRMTAVEDAPAGIVSKVARFAMGGGVSFCLVAFLYWAGLPSKEHRRRMPVVPGALAVVILNSLVGFGYGLYIAKTGTGDAYQAGLAVIGVTLTALYLFSATILVGAEINQVIGERRARARGEAPLTATAATAS